MGGEYQRAPGEKVFVPELHPFWLSSSLHLLVQSSLCSLYTRFKQAANRKDVILNATPA